MNRDKKTEIVDNKIGETLEELYKEYKGEIQLVSESKYSSGRIVIQVK